MEGAENMAKEDKIYIKIELCKDKESDELTLMTYFDSNAPNFSNDEEGYYWMPTIEERDFLNEAFELVPTHGIKSPSETITEPPEKKDDMEPEVEVSTENKEPDEEPELKPIEEEVTPEPTPEHNMNKEEKKSWKLPSPFDRKGETEEKPTDTPPLEKKEEDGIFEVTEEEHKLAEEENKMEGEEKDILVEADEAAIDAALKKKSERDRSMVEADEDTIVEKVLSQKKKGKWGKGH